MPNVVGVQFQKAGKLEYYAPNQLDVEVTGLLSNLKEV